MASAAFARVTMTPLGEAVVAVASILRVPMSATSEAIMAAASFTRVTMTSLGQAVVTVPAVLGVTVTAPVEEY